MCVCVCVCVCVCERERERERERESVRVRERERERESVCVCVCERESVCVCVCVCMFVHMLVVVINFILIITHFFQVCSEVASTFSKKRDRNANVAYATKGNQWIGFDDATAVEAKVGTAHELDVREFAHQFSHVARALFLRHYPQHIFIYTYMASDIY